jgi:hypothetical protein
MKEKKGKEFPFKVPEFDEEEFIKTEHSKAYVTLLAVALSVLMALIARILWDSLQANDIGFAWRISFLVGMMGLILLPLWFKIFRIDFSKIGKGGWLSSVIYYFFLFIGIFILLVNPPFCDATPPHVEITILPNMQEAGGGVKIIAKLGDNVGIAPSTLELMIKKPNGEQLTKEQLAQKGSISDNLIEIPYENEEKIMGEHIFEIRVKDVNGQLTDKRVNFSYSDEAISLLKPPNNSTIDETPNVVVELDKSIFIKDEKGEVVPPIVYLRVKSNQSDKRFDLKYDKDTGLYRSKRDEEGLTKKWDKGSVEVKVFAEVISKDGKYKNLIEDSTTYHFIVE